MVGEAGGADMVRRWEGDWGTLAAAGANGPKASGIPSARSMSFVVGIANGNWGAFGQRLATEFRH